VTALLLLPALATAAETNANTADVWQRHVSRAMTGDLDSVMQDFGDDSVIITTD